VNCIKYSPDGKLLATSSTDLTVNLWLAQTGELARTLNYRSFIRSMDFSPNGKTLTLGACGRAIELYNLKSEWLD
jgi:WD40 repeat protein